MPKAGRDLSGLLSDLIRWGETVERVVVVTSRDAILRDHLAELALERSVEIFGDIAGRLQRGFPEWCDEHAPGDFSDAYRLRNKLAHGYDNIRPDILFEIARDDVAALTAKARSWLVALGRDVQP